MPCRIDTVKEEITFDPRFAPGFGKLCQPDDLKPHYSKLEPMSTPACKSMCPTTLKVKEKSKPLACLSTTGELRVEGRLCVKGCKDGV